MCSSLTHCLTLCMVLSCVPLTEGLIHVFGYVGRKAQVPCPYPRGYESYMKYLCRNECGHSDILIETNQANKSKYSTAEDRRTGVVTVTISDLSSSDAGKYYCGVSRTGKDIYHEVKLHVEPDHCCDEAKDVQGQEESNMTIICPYKSEDERNLKYICRGNQPSTCLQQALVTSDYPTKTRFSLEDETVSRRFTVTISSLAKSDSGSYLCGLHRSAGLDVFSGVVLEVREWCCLITDKVNETAGSPVTLRCPYQAHHQSNHQFLCKGEHRESCADIAMRPGKAGRTDGRFALKHDVASSAYLVTIQKLEAGDAGTYWCGYEPRWKTGVYTKIQLSVVLQSPTSTVTSHPTTIQVTEDSKVFSDTSTTVLVTVVTVIVILVLALVTLCAWCSCSKAQRTKVIVGQNTNRAEAEVESSVADDYENQEVVVCSNMGTSKQLTRSKQLGTWHRGDDDAGEDPDDSIYQNVTEDNIYCNQFSARANKR